MPIGNLWQQRVLSISVTILHPLNGLSRFREIPKLSPPSKVVASLGSRVQLFDLSLPVRWRCETQDLEGRRRECLCGATASVILWPEQRQGLVGDPDHVVSMLGSPAHPAFSILLKIHALLKLLSLIFTKNFGATSLLSWWLRTDCSHHCLLSSPGHLTLPQPAWESGMSFSSLLSYRLWEVVVTGPAWPSVSSK